MPLPLELTGLGMKGCYQIVSVDVVVGAPVTFLGFSLSTFTIPSDSKLVGLVFHMQHWAKDAGANTASLVTSNGVSIKIGG